MLKHTHTIRRQQSTICLSVDHLMGLALRGLTIDLTIKTIKEDTKRRH